MVACVNVFQPLPPWEENGPGIGYRVYWKLKGDDDFADQRVYLELLSNVVVLRDLHGNIRPMILHRRHVKTL